MYSICTQFVLNCKPTKSCSKKLQVVQCCCAAFCLLSRAASGKLWTNPDRVFCVSLSVWQFLILLTELPVDLHVLRQAYSTCHHPLPRDNIHDSKLEKVDHGKIQDYTTLQSL